MNTRNLKNILATIGYISTILCVAATPEASDWYIIMYVIYSIAVGIGHDEDHD